MNLPSPFQKRPSELQKTYVQVRLTPEGQRAAEDFDGNGNKFEILAALNQKQPQTIGNLAKSASIPFNECLKCCKELKHEGLLQQVSRNQ